MIEWDEARGGNYQWREVAWDELGRMLRSYEDWQFMPEIRDKTKSFNERRVTTECQRPRFVKVCGWPSRTN